MTGIERMIFVLESILFNEIPVKDIQKSISWYKDVLGLRYIWYSEEEKLAQLNLLSGHMLFLNETSDHTTANFTINGKIHSVIGFQTKNIEYL